MKKPLQPHLLKRVPPACKGERTMRWRGRPPIGGQDNDGVSLLCSAPYTLLPLRGISPQGETRNLRRKTESHILHVPLRNSPFSAWRHHLARWEACHWIRGSRGSPMNPVPLPPPQFGGAAKGKRLNGQARRLTSPHLEVLCRTSTGDYRAPLCCELLMKGLLFRALFCPLNRGKSGAARIGGCARHGCNLMGESP